MPTHFSDALRFLQALFAPYGVDDTLRLEIRPLFPEWRKAEFYPDDDAPFNWQCRTPYGCREWFLLSARGLVGAMRHALWLAEAYETYFGVLPRVGRTGKQADVPITSWLWSDLDAGTDNIDAAIRLVKQSDLPTPHIAVCSGGGLHAYWRLREVVALPDDDARLRFKNLLRRLCQQIGGESPCAHADSSRADTASILRIPQTYNNKRQEEPRPVKLLHFAPEEDALPLSWWGANLPALPLPPPKLFQRDTSALSVGDGLLRWARVPYPQGKRHKDLAGAAAWLVRTVGLEKSVALELLSLKASVSWGLRPITPEELEAIVRWA